jgi:hypothetical protein
MEQVQDCANGEIAFQLHKTTVPLRVLIAGLTVVGRYPGPMTRLAVDDLRQQGSGRLKTADPRVAAGRAFVRSLNILLKFARLYGFGHARTGQQVQIAWEELRAAVPE